MRLSPRILAAALFAGSAGVASAQVVPIVVAHPLTVGAITRDAGVYSAWNGGHDLAIMRKVNGSLINLESDLAGKLSTLKGISYQDRTATGALLNEVHMSSGRDFDQMTGALRGLMGRLDFLIVIDAVDASNARMRLIDVETGSVKGVENCHVGAYAACVGKMADKLKAAGQEQAGATGALLAQRDAMMAVKPQYDEQVARYDADKLYWDHVRSTMSAGGHLLRPEIQSLLTGSAKDIETGTFAVKTLDVNTLTTVTGALSEKLDKLDTFR